MNFGSGRGGRLGLVVATSLAVLAGSSAAFAATSWAMLDARTGRFVGEDGGQRLHPPASLAKMMTIYVTFEALKSGRLKWNDRIAFSANASSKIPMKLGVRPGDSITVREAVDSMVVLSANDTAAAVGEHLAGSEAAFARVMTQKARQLGMRDTVFANPSGLTDRDTQVTTARDMAILGLALQRNFPREFALFSQPSFTFRGKVKKGHNNLMYRYDGVDGIKTGYTRASGYNLVSSLNSGGQRLVGAVLGGQSARKRDDLMASLLTRFSTGGTLVAKAVPAKPQVSVSSQSRLQAAMVPVPRERPASEDAIAALIPQQEQIEQGDGGYPVASLGGEWRIQVGSLPDKASADRLQARLAPAVRASTPAAQGLIELFQGSVSSFYRVQFSGFGSGSAAESACASLKRQDVDCFVIADR
ncbi:D-alanyl-D-alanine carboxypeptidase [Rhizobiaceae bacterium BDR2-2]|uniref:D-alanyl-D-alanine carboxypeptidase n=1 Tax=Ectorhizobium quercum TaxID=2965071 RepID=A0AAE3N1U3_9HYPH|nr:D-alanyl-D-alanine carboxypeptidase [Ectorhizobium quercum]MCX8997725.1 D-alanyl-D-alanine carboxypeptidase [Ectorhizobium quercum]